MVGDYSGKKVVITGGLGFVGRNLVDELLIQDVSFITIIDDCSNSSPQMPEHWPSKKIKHVKESVTTVDWAEYLDDSVYAVFHLACKTVIECDSNPLYDAEVNTISTLKILEHLRTLPEAGRPRLVYSSTACVYGKTTHEPVSEISPVKPNHQYGVSKLASENYIAMYSKKHGIEAVVVRLSNVYGPYQTPSNPYCGVIGIFITQASMKQPLSVIGDGKQTRDFTYAVDCVRSVAAVAQLAELSGEIYNISAGKEISIELLADVVSSLYPGATVEYIPKRDIDDIEHRVLDSSKLKKSGLGSFRTIEEGLASTKEWYDKLNNSENIMKKGKE